MTRPGALKGGGKTKFHYCYEKRTYADSQEQTSFFLTIAFTTHE